MKKLIFFSFFMFVAAISYSQNIENVDFKINGSKIIVTYNLVNSGSKYNYDKSDYLFDIGIRFKDETGNEIVPKNPSGDLIRVNYGNNKTIVWDVLGDNQEIKGTFSVVLEIVKTHYFTKPSKDRVKGGPSNAFLSMLMPGLGDYFVNSPNNRKYIYLLPLAYIACSIRAYTEYEDYQKNYSDYHSSVYQNMIDHYYDAANTNFKNTQIYLGVAASIWVADVIYVAVKGYKNLNRSRGYSYVQPKASMYFVTGNKNFQLGLIYKL
ncbi:MAG: hypothetical protein WCG87_02510 [Bacteroidota bacterium]